MSSFAQNNYFDTRNSVGEISFDPTIDNPTFELIDEKSILPYNTICGFHIKGERYGVLKYFFEKFKSDTIKGVTGYITIRFIVNHKGHTDRFRVFEMDSTYKPYNFPSNIRDSLLFLTKNLEGWNSTLDYKLHNYQSIKIECDSTLKYAYDYYQYILFKIKDGQIETILP